MTANDSDKPKPRRRWLQYSLRTFFVLLTVFGVSLGVVVFRAHEQRRVVESVGEMGGTVGYDCQRNANGRMIYAEPPGPKWLVELIGVDYFQEVSLVGLPVAQDSDLTSLAKLTNLRVLSLQDTQVSDLNPLTKLMSLEELWLNGSKQVSDLTPLAKLTSIELLALDDTRVNDLTPLAKLTSLQELRLNSTPVDDLTPLVKLTNLSVLYLNDTPIHDLTPLAKLTSLQQLWLGGTQVSDVTPL
ncbi:leucine-rich repeat domain-containing protein, partial [bacterium]|nr:leucine-rich repeat domain-containing protein [bacterium]